jgi:AhpD family alkylhydroperoxidase
MKGGTMIDRLKDFQQFRQKMDERILASGNLEIKRFFALDKNTYKQGALPAETKELLGLVASLVLRCNDCVTYHLLRCVELEIDDQKLFESFNIALVVGGSIVIPHLRKAVSRLEEIRSLQKERQE